MIPTAARPTIATGTSERSEPVAGFLEAPACGGYLLPDLSGVALSHFRAGS